MQRKLGARDALNSLKAGPEKSARRRPSARIAAQQKRRESRRERERAGAGAWCTGRLIRGVWWPSSSSDDDYQQDPIYLSNYYANRPSTPGLVPQQIKASTSICWTVPSLLPVWFRLSLTLILLPKDYHGSGAYRGYSYVHAESDHRRGFYCWCMLLRVGGWALTVYPRAQGAITAGKNSM